MSEEVKLLVPLFSIQGTRTMPEQAIKFVQDGVLARSAKFKFTNSLAGKGGIRREDIEKEIDRIFSGIDIIEQIIEAWKWYEDFQVLLNPDKYPCDKTYEVTLIKHSVSSSYERYLELVISRIIKDIRGIRIVRINFELELEAVIESAKLWIRCGRIIKILPATLTATATLFCEAQGIKQKICTVESEVNLPEINPENGIEIPKLKKND